MLRRWWWWCGARFMLLLLLMLLLFNRWWTGFTFTQNNMPTTTITSTSSSVCFVYLPLFLLYNIVFWGFNIYIYCIIHISIRIGNTIRVSLRNPFPNASTSSIRRKGKGCCCCCYGLIAIWLLFFARDPIFFFKVNKNHATNRCWLVLLLWLVLSRFIHPRTVYILSIYKIILHLRCFTHYLSYWKRWNC